MGRFILLNTQFHPIFTMTMNNAQIVKVTYPLVLSNLEVRRFFQSYLTTLEIGTFGDSLKKRLKKKLNMLALVKFGPEVSKHFIR